jgi:tight adherence protein C
VSPLLLYLLLFVLTAGACAALYQAVSRGQGAVANRLRREAQTQRRVSGQLPAVVQRAIDRWPAGPPEGSAAQQKLSSTLVKAGFRNPQAGAIFQLTRVSLMIGFALLGFAVAVSLGGSVPALAAMGSILGYLVPTLVIRRIATARQRRIKAELPDTLALLVVSLEAGIGFSEVVKLVGREVERQGRVMGQELSATAAQMAAGRSLEDSLKELGERTGVDEVKSLVALAIQSEKVGASMAPALRASAEMLNSQRRLAAEEAAHKTAVKMLVPLVFLILPALMLIVLGPAAIQIFRMFSPPK